MEIDPRGPRFSALITTVVLVTGSVWLLAAQAVVFAVGSVAGLRYSPYGVLWRRLIRPRLGPPQELEPEAPPRFAQTVGLVFAAIGRVNLVDVRSPDEFAGRLLPRRTCRRSRRSAAATSPGPRRALVEGGRRGRHVPVR